MRVLIVEDDETFRAELIKVFAKIDPEIQVSTAENAEETIGFMDSQHLNPNFGYDLIISDVTLNGAATGFDLWRVCSDRYPSTYFVFMSGISAFEFLEKLKNEPRCPPFLTKPFVLSQFKNLIREVLDHKAKFLKD